MGTEREDSFGSGAMTQIESFRELRVYQAALDGASRIFDVTRSFPRDERFALTDQVRRSSRAVSALVAEGWARRRYPAAFVNKINEALGEAHETQAWLDHARRCHYLDDETHSTLDPEWQAIGAMLHRMTQRADGFTQKDRDA